MSATRYIGIVTPHPQVLSGEVVGAASGGTLAGGQVVQVVYDDGTFTSAAEGKQRLLAALDYITKRIEASKVWPIDNTVQ